MKSQVKIYSVVLAVIMYCLPAPALYSQIAIRSLPQTTPSASDLFPFARPSGGTWVTDLTGILSTLGAYVIPPSTVLNCTPPIQCNGGLSAYLNTPVTVSVTTSAFVSSGRQLFTPAPLVCDGATSCDLSADRTLSLLACGPHTIMAGPVSGVSPGSPSCVSALGNTVINQTFNSDTVYTSTRATDTAPTGNFQLFKNAAGGTLWQVDITGSLAAGTVPVARVTGLATSATTDTTNATNISSGTLNSSRLPSIAHSSLTSLSADDHTIYALLAGRSGGATWTVGTAASDGLTIKPTSNATMGVVSITGNTTTLPAIGGTGTLLRIGSADATNTGLEIQSHATGIGSPLIYFGRSNGTAASPTALANNDTVGGLQWFGYGTAYTTARAAFQCIASQTWTGSANGTQCDLYTTPNGTTTLTKAWSIDNAGHQVMSGTTPAVTCTGTGTSPSTPTVVGTDGGFTVTMFTGTGTPANTGTCTITFNKVYGASPPMVCMLVVGASSWANEANIQQTTESASAPVVTWVNEASTVLTGLTASSNYKFSCIVMGR